ncbi:MAG: glyoxalase superfamily protein [Pseudomonadota bacterium]
MTRSKLGTPVPILKVADVRINFAYDTDVLGFSPDWDDGGMVSVSRGRCTLLLCEWEQGASGSWIWVGVDDCAALHAELAGRGARVRQPPTRFPWALEMQIEDPDDNVLRLGSEPVAGSQRGQFLDARGRPWDGGPGDHES